MKSLWFKIAVILVLAFPLFSTAQVEAPPSLLIGLTGLTNERGTIDTEVLASVILEKQDELKKEIIKRTFYDRLGGKSYVVWEFAYNSLEVLLNFQDKQVMEKELLEYAANLAIVYSFTEGYLQASRTFCNTDLEAVVTEWKKQTSRKRIPDFSCASGKRPASFELLLPLLRDSVASDADFNLSAVLLDMSFEVLRKNKTLQGLGFFHSQFPLGESYYDQQSQYLKRVTQADALSSRLKALHDRMQDEVEIFIDNYYAIKVALDQKIQSAREVPEHRTMDILKSIRNIYRDLSKISPSILQVPSDTSLFRELNASLRGLENFRSRLINAKSSTGNKEAIFNTNDLYYLYEVQTPLLIKLVTRYGLNPDYLAVSDSIKQKLLHQLLGNIETKSDSWMAQNKRNKRLAVNDSLFLHGNFASRVKVLAGFVDVFSHFQALDQAETYQYILRELRNVSSLFEDPNLAFLVFNLTDFLEKNTLLDAEKNAIRVDVEEIILQLFRKYEARLQKNPVQFYFSIGLDQTFGIRYASDQYALRQDSATRLSSLSFASEKIGLKVKLCDWKRQRSYDYGEFYKKNKKISTFRTRQPVVNDVYFLIYGSGLLYNITNTTTGKNFTYPMLGASLGLAFYNNLDVNLFVNAPLVSDESLERSLQRRQLAGFSFDIKIADYIAAVRKKRNERKANDSNGD